MKKRLLFSSIVVLFILSNSNDLFAKRGGGKGHGRPGHYDCRDGGFHKGVFFGNPEMMKERFGLSDDQVNKISEINLEYKKKLLKIKEKIAPKRINLQSMLLEDNVNLKKVRSLLKEISELKIEIRMLRIKQRLDIEKLLTPSQKNRLRGSRMGMGKGGMHFHQPPCALGERGQ
ncbi:MAG: Spy/CpxP family protein refolding chaperone [Spirochaetota bacterium]|nr:Spy/CpxP family protein refolding chaperone [Spirochaetota bacterium]